MAVAKKTVVAQKRVEKAKSGPLHAARIEDYAMIGDCRTAALISKEGSLDWLCWPNFSSVACFASLLGTKDHGYWSLSPKGKVKHRARQYRRQTMVLETEVETSGGKVRLTDFMPVGRDHSHVIRTVEGLEGEVGMRMELAIRFDYGRTVPWVTRHKKALQAIAGDNMVVLRSSASSGREIELSAQDMTTVAEFAVHKGEKVSFVLTYMSSLEEIPKVPAEGHALVETERFWKEWMAQGNTYEGPHRDMVERSLLTLKALTYTRSGGIVAAVTAGLPEEIGGVRNWDYRYCWLRDTAFTLLVLIQAGFDQEAESWRQWLRRAIAGAPDQVQTMYGINGERQLPEWDAHWLPGYEGSSPVRIGNAAADQFQLDVFGEVMTALVQTPVTEKDTRVSAASMQAAVCDHLCDIWKEPDDGIWESRGGQLNYTYSKVMAWAALDRAIRNSAQLGGQGDVKRWIKNRDEIHKEVCEKGFSKKLNSFVQSYGSEELDASCLRIAIVGFLPPEDPRIRGTVEAIERKLMPDGLVERYDTNSGSDGLPGKEGAFLTCSFWFVINLYLIGRKDDANALLDRLLALANDVGLISEEYDPKAKRMLGNFPQALSHISVVHAAFTVGGLWKPEVADQT